MPASGDPGVVLTIRKSLLGSAALAAALLWSHVAYAQRATENPTTSADDAFGTRVGNEGVGLYDQNNARGFSPQLAGNLRVEGLYIDIQGLFGARLTRSTSMRIGLGAQSFPFPAPTGISDIAIVQPADHTVVSVQLQYANPFGMSPNTIDLSTPIFGDKLGMVAGINSMIVRGDARVAGRIQTNAITFRWRPVDNFEVLPFYYRNFVLKSESSPQILLAGAALPPEFDRNVFYGQDWAYRRTDEENYGFIARGNPVANWRVQGGFFHTEQRRRRNDVVFFRNTQASGIANVDVLHQPGHFSGSYSGEVRASGVYTTGKFRHTVHIGSRGRSVLRRFGGTQTVSLGTGMVGVYQPVPEPVFVTGALDIDRVEQYTPGVTYVGQWAGVGEFSVGLQKSFYDRNYTKAGVAPAITKSKPWLYNGTVSVFPTKDLTLYASYTRGLEEFGIAPDNAINRGEPLPVKETKQIDGGLRYRIMPGVNLLAGIFEISKPYFDRNPTNIYTDVGALRHRGAEFSLTGKPIPNLTVVAGAVLLQARVSGFPVETGFIGRIPQGTPPSLYRLSLQYNFPQLNGFSLDTQLESTGSHYANRTNTVRVPSANTITLGSRYEFKVRDVNASIRAQVYNVTNTYAWNVDNASGRLTPIQPRRYLVRLSADF